MSFGKMNKIAYIKKKVSVQDDDGFVTDDFKILRKVRVYQEGRHGSERWSNLAAFSEATDLFRFRFIPNLTINTDLFIELDGVIYDIESVENVKGKNMYIEILAKRSVSSIG